MSFKVRWQRTAKDQLASIWINATDRAAVTAALQQIDALLETNPHKTCFHVRDRGRMGLDE